MYKMENKKTDGLHELEEQCRELAQRASWVIEALPRPLKGGIEAEEMLRKACQYVESLLTELRDIVHSVKALEVSLLTERATAAEKDEAAASAFAKVEDADKKIAAASKMESDAEASIHKYAELKSGLEAERAEVQSSMKQLASMLDAARRDTDALAKKNSDLDKSIEEARETKEAAASVEKRRAEAEKDVVRLQKTKDGLIGEWDRLVAERQRLESDAENYNKKVKEYSKFKADVARELGEERARVGRRDETITRLHESVKQERLSLSVLESKYHEEAGKVKEKERVIAEMRLNQERAFAAELQARLSQASAGMDAAQERAASEYEGLLQKLNEMKISQEGTLGTLQEDTKYLKEAMALATQTMAEGTAASKTLKTYLSPNVKAVKGTVEQIGVMRTQLQVMEEAYAARQRDEAARARKHMVELIHEIDSQTRHQHQQELADLRRDHEAQLNDLCRTKDLELAGVRQQLEEDLDSTRREARESQLMADELRQQSEGAGPPPASPERRHKKPRPDESQPHIWTPPPSALKGEGPVGAEKAKWQAALQSATEFWCSFEPRLIDRAGEPNYRALLYQLNKAVRDEVARSRFMDFVHSDATGWHCVEAVVEHGVESPVRQQTGKCGLKRHKKAAECLRMQRAGGHRVDFQFVKNK